MTLPQSEANLRAVIDALPVGVLVWRADGLLHFANRRASDIAGRPIEHGLSLPRYINDYRLLYAGTDDLYSPDAVPTVAGWSGQPGRFADAEFELPNGQRRPVEGWAAPVPGDDGTVAYAVAVFNDITDRKRAEALRAGEARVLEMIAGGAPLAETLDTLARRLEAEADGMLASILLIDDGVHVRHGAAPNLPAAWIQAVDGEPIGPDRGSCGSAAFLKQTVIVADIATDARWAIYRDTALANGLRACWSVPIMGPDQEVLGTFALYYREPREPTPRLLELATHGGHLAAVAIIHHRHEAALIESEGRSRAIVEHALDANVVMDGDGVVTAWNPRATAIFGWTAEEALGRKLSALIIPEHQRVRHEQGLRHYLESGEGPIINTRIEITALHKDGHEIPVHLAVTPIRRGERVMFSAFLEDITASRTAALALRESEHHLKLVYDHVDDVLFQLRVEPVGYRFVSVNPAFTLATGLAAELVVGKLVHEVIPEPSRSLVLARYAEAIQTHRTVRWEETTTYPTGTRHGDVAVTPVFDAAGQPKYLVGSVRDITQQRAMELEVRQLQKLDAIGRLSGGIAHDFNNILGVIVGVGNMLLKEVSDPDQRIQVEEIVKAGERGANLTRQFLAFGRKQVLQPQSIDLGDIVHNLESMLRRLIREDILLTTATATSLWRVRADPGQIEQVVVNLVVNARDAMPAGGAVTIDISNVELDEQFARAHAGSTAGAFVLLEVSDTGHGMDADTRKLIFEPFFTTKEVGKGTGLGLATVYGIVKQSGGHILVDSVPGHGASFKVYLPRGVAVAEPARADRAERPSGPTRALAGLHVLLVEDEPALRRAIERMLVRLQCRVTAAPNGADALEAVAAQGAAPELVITDMVMPGMSGTDLARQLRELNPGLKVLTMSGYSEQMSDPDALDPSTLFLQKPFTMNQLARGIQAVIEASPGPDLPS